MVVSRYSRIYLLGIALLGIFLFLITAYLFTQALDGADSPGCRQVFMGPSYARIRAFDESHTKFASKYSLYLYREQGKDPLPDSGEATEFLDGIPVLFIPGNAGSYRQVRSIAAKSADLYFEENIGDKNYDFFAAEFNEDFTAFHGRTMLDQAEFLNDAIKYILYLYSSKENPPKSVLLLGHSMGGIVARVMLTLPNYVEGSVQTVVTLASPHAAAPLTTDSDILRIYSAIDRFWYEGYHVLEDSVQNRRLQNVSLISITGGLLDNTLPADYTSLGFLIPESHGFTVYTTGIKNVWTPIDHLAIVWCSQLRTQILQMLMEFADDSSPTKQKPLTERMKIVRKWLLTGFEDACAQDKDIRDPLLDGAFQLELEESQMTSIENKLIISGSSSSLIHTISLKDVKNLNVLSSSIQSWEEHNEDNSHSSVLFCKKYSEDQDLNQRVYDLREDKKSKLILNYLCVDAIGDVITIPNPSAQTLKETSHGGEKQPFSSLRYGKEDLDQYEYAFFFPGTTENLLVADALPCTSLVTKDSLLGLLFKGTTIEIPSNRPIITNVEIRGAWSSILVYSLHFNGHKGSDVLFAPFIRQWKSNPYETKWHVQLKEDISLSLHGIAPFAPFKSDFNTHGQRLNLELWSISEPNQEPLKLTLQVDIVLSLRLLVVRYRLAIIAFCVAITVNVLAIQVNSFSHSKSFPSFTSGLAELTSPKILGITFIVLSLLTPISRIPFVQQILDLVDPVVLQDRNEINLSLHADYRLNSYYLGLEETSLWIVGPLFYIIGIGIVSLTYWIINIVARSVRYVAYKFNTKKKTNEKKATEGSKKLNDRRRFVFFFVACLCISLYLPYQVGYVVCCIIQMVVVAKLSLNGNKSVFNYNVAFLMVMIWVLPINIPVLIVFAHNVSVDWTTPFSSHHNILALLPIMIIVGRHTNGNYLPKLERGSLAQKVFFGYTIYFTGYCFMYGIRHTFWIHHLFNLACCILFIVEVENEQTTSKS